LTGRGHEALAIEHNGNLRAAAENAALDVGAHFTQREQVSRLAQRKRKSS
jgi:hypothetical protein